MRLLYLVEHVIGPCYYHNGYIYSWTPLPQNISTWRTMSLKIVESILKKDLDLLVTKLNSLYQINKSHTSFARYPIIKYRNYEVKGYPISDNNLHYLEVIPHRRKVLAIDASLKVLFNLGTYKIIASKVIATIWRGLKRIYDTEPIYRVTLVQNKMEAAEWLLRIELEELFRHFNKLNKGDYCLLDRGLFLPYTLKQTTLYFVKKIVENALRNLIIVIGMPKKTKIILNDGQNALSYISEIAERKFKGMPWYYYPLFTRDNSKYLFGDCCVVRLSEESDNIFRVDLLYPEVEGEEVIGYILGQLAYLQDSSLPGYPYPLKAVHDESRLEEYEIDFLKGRIIDLLKETKLIEKFKRDLSTSVFKERYLWNTL